MTSVTHYYVCDIIHIVVCSSYSFFLLICGIPQNKFIIFLLVDIWLVSSFWLFLIKLSWIFSYGSFDKYIVSILGVEFLSYCFPKRLYYFLSPPTMEASFSCSTFLSKFAIVSLFNFDHSGERVVASNLYFPDK